MIVVDTSALVAILFGEADAPDYYRVIASAERVVIAAPTAFELRLVAFKRRGQRVTPLVEGLLTDPVIEIVAWTPDLVALAMAAAVRYGGRPARLNFGDCIAYALAKSLDAPLLFKGDDFRYTNVRSALA